MEKLSKTLIALANTKVKWKWSNIFSPNIETINNSSRAMVEAMNRMNTTQIEIENKQMIVHEHTFKKHLNT
jgi:TRAP-type mannitol/chloroaromatic compound transport system substrate-binding protein